MKKGSKKIWTRVGIASGLIAIASLAVFLILFLFIKTDKKSGIISGSNPNVSGPSSGGHGSNPNIEASLETLTDEFYFEVPSVLKNKSKLKTVDIHNLKFNIKRYVGVTPNFNEDLIDIVIKNKSEDQKVKLKSISKTEIETQYQHLNAPKKEIPIDIELYYDNQFMGLLTKAVVPALPVNPTLSFETTDLNFKVSIDNIQQITRSNSLDRYGQYTTKPIIEYDSIYKPYVVPENFVYNWKIQSNGLEILDSYINITKAAEVLNFQTYRQGNYEIVLDVKYKQSNNNIIEHIPVQKPFTISNTFINGLDPNTIFTLQYQPLDSQTPRERELGNIVLDLDVKQSQQIVPPEELEYRIISPTQNHYSATLINKQLTITPTGINKSRSFITIGIYHKDNLLFSSNIDLPPFCMRATRLKSTDVHIDLLDWATKNEVTPFDVTNIKPDEKIDTKSFPTWKLRQKLSSYIKTDVKPESFIEGSYSNVTYNYDESGFEEVNNTDDLVSFSATVHGQDMWGEQVILKMNPIVRLRKNFVFEIDYSDKFGEFRGWEPIRQHSVPFDSFTVYHDVWVSKDNETMFHFYKHEDSNEYDNGRYRIWSNDLSSIRMPASRWDNVMMPGVEIVRFYPRVFDTLFFDKKQPMTERYQDWPPFWLSNCDNGKIIQTVNHKSPLYDFWKPNEFQTKDFRGDHIRFSPIVEGNRVRGSVSGIRSRSEIYLDSAYIPESIIYSKPGRPNIEIPITEITDLDELSGGIYEPRVRYPSIYHLTVLATEIKKIGRVFDCLKDLKTLTVSEELYNIRNQWMPPYFQNVTPTHNKTERTWTYTRN